MVEAKSKVRYRMEERMDSGRRNITRWITRWIARVDGTAHPPTTARAWLASGLVLTIATLVPQPAAAHNFEAHNIEAHLLPSYARKRPTRRPPNLVTRMREFAETTLSPHDISGGLHKRPPTAGTIIEVHADKLFSRSIFHGTAQIEIAAANRACFQVRGDGTLEFLGHHGDQRRKPRFLEELTRLRLDAFESMKQQFAQLSSEQQADYYSDLKQVVVATAPNLFGYAGFHVSEAPQRAEDLVLTAAVIGRLGSTAAFWRSKDGADYALIRASLDPSGPMAQATVEPTPPGHLRVRRTLDLSTLVPFEATELWAKALLDTVRADLNHDAIAGHRF